MQLAIVPDPQSDRQEGKDFLLQGHSAWIRVGNLVVYLRHDLKEWSVDMVKVSVYPIEKAAENPLAEIALPLVAKEEHHDISDWEGLSGTV